MTDEQKEQFEELKTAQKETLQKINELNTSATVRNISLKRDAQKQRLETMQDGLQKELALLKFEYDNRRKQAAGSNEMIAALTAAQAQKEREIRRKYAEEYLKQNEEIVRKLTETTLSLMNEGFEKDLSLLRESYRQRIEEVKTQLRTERTLTENKRGC